jgi:4-amino-4-deoxychorismate lyase
MNALATRVFRGADDVAGIAALDRGLAYGDGLFETMRLHAGGVPWFARHWARLALGAQRLAIPLPPRALVEASAADLLRTAPHAGVLKLVLTRGEGGRGYAPPADPVPTWVLSAHALPPIHDGLRMVRCRIALALQPALAGLKHCNRLEQVLARAEVDAAGADEGLLLDMDGQLAGAVSGNLLLQLDGAWWTPPVDRCGVAGVLRGWLLERGLARERALGEAELAGASALAVCNAVRGILAVRQLDARAFAPAAPVEILRAALAQAHPAFAMELQ